MIIMNNLGRSESDRAGVASAPPSSRRGLQGARTRKCCYRSTLPVEKNSGYFNRWRHNKKKCATVRKCSRADLRQSQVDRRRLWDVHDLPVWCHDEDESVQRLRGRERKREAGGYYLSVLPPPRPRSDSSTEYCSCTCSKWDPSSRPMLSNDLVRLVWPHASPKPGQSQIAPENNGTI